jgi:hypothetical protein
MNIIQVGRLKRFELPAAHSGIQAEFSAGFSFNFTGVSSSPFWSVVHKLLPLP